MQTLEGTDIAEDACLKFNFLSGMRLPVNGGRCHGRVGKYYDHFNELFMDICKYSQHVGAGV